METGNDSSYLWKIHNNPGGIKCGIEYCSYATEEDGMDALRSLMTYYYEKYGTDLAALRADYTRMTGESLENDIKEFITIFNEEMEKIKWELKQTN